MLTTIRRMKSQTNNLLVVELNIEGSDGNRRLDRNERKKLHLKAKIKRLIECSLQKKKKKTF